MVFFLPFPQMFCYLNNTLQQVDSRKFECCTDTNATNLSYTHDSWYQCGNIATYFTSSSTQSYLDSSPTRRRWTKEEKTGFPQCDRFQVLLLGLLFLLSSRACGTRRCGCEKPETSGDETSLRWDSGLGRMRNSVAHINQISAHASAARLNNLKPHHWASSDCTSLML